MLDLEADEAVDALAAVRRAVQHGCLARARRYFVEAEAIIPKAARGPEQLPTPLIAAMGELYAIETCKANGTEPYIYLIELFRQLPLAKTVEDYETLLPWRLTSPND